MNTDNLILRETDNLPLINKDDTLTSADLDGNFIKIYNDFLALSTANDPTLVFDIDRSYAIGEYATYNGKMWVSTIEVTGVTPDIDSLEWLDIFPTILAHEKNKDTYLDYGGANATSVAEIRAFIDAGLTSTTNLSLTTKTGTSFKIESSTGTDVIIPQASVTDAGLLNAEDKIKLNNLSGINTGDQTLASLNAEDVDNKVTDFTTINDTLYPTTQAVDTYLTAQVPDLVEIFLDSNVEVTTNKATDFTTVNDTKYPTVKAVDDHINSKLAGLWDDRGSYDASTNLFPSTGGSGGSGAIMKGDIWTINVEGTLGGTLMHVGDTVRALTDAPGQTSTNWALLENAIGYVPENVINKVTTFSGNTTSDTKYPSVKAIVDNFDATNIKSILGVTVLSGSNTGDQDLSGLMVKSNNLSDLTNTTTARTNLGLGTLATQSGTFSGTSSGTNTGDQIISDATLTTTDITTNNFSTTKHGFVPKGTNVGNFLKDDGTWGAVASAIPQANTIYVDSVNGVNETTGRGDINKPYLTPEYALANITNTGTVTATTTSTSATLTAVSDTTNIKVGQYITGTGIPYNSIVVSKTSNTIVLSKTCTASATITATWWTVYNVILSGNFVVTSNIHKIGFYINSSSLSATISYGNLTLFTFTSNILIPIYISLGKTFGTHANSCLIDGAGFSAIDGFLNLGNYYSLYTSFNLGGIGTSALTFTNLTINTEMFDCRFGSISYISVSGNFTWNGNAYGLLGGLRYSGTNIDVNGKITTPSSVNAINGSSTRGNINGAILGSYTHTGGINLYANVVGTTALIDSGDGVKSVNVYGSLSMTTINLGSSPNILNGDITGNVNVNGLSNILGNVVNGTIVGTVTVNSGSIKYNGNQEGNHGSRYMTVVIGNGNFINSGSIRLVSLTYTGIGKFTNDGAIFTNGSTNTSAPIRITNGGKFINNQDITQNPETDICPLVEKTDGVFVNNGRMYSPFNMYVKYAANTSASKEVILAYAMSNGNILANSTTGTGIINRFVVTSANTDTSVTIFDGTNTVVISVIGAGKTVAVISAEIVTQIKASILLFQNCSYPVIGNVVFVGRTGFTPTFTSTTNISSLGTYAGGGGFSATVLGGGTELLSSSFNY